MLFILPVTSVAILFCVVKGDELPSYFLKCRKSDPHLDQCVASSTNKALKYFSKGDPAFDIPSFHPFKIPLITLNTQDLKAKLTNASVDGISNAHVLEAKMDFEEKHFVFLIKTPNIKIASNYSVSGKFLVVPISTEGNGNITFDKVILRFSFTYDLVKFQGEEYIKLTNASLIYAFDNISVDLDNFSKFSNTASPNWEEIFETNPIGLNDEIGNKIGEAIAESMVKILSTLFSRVPFNKLFDE